MNHADSNRVDTAYLNLLSRLCFLNSATVTSCTGPMATIKGKASSPGFSPLTFSIGAYIKILKAFVNKDIKKKYSLFGFRKGNIFMERDYCRHYNVHVVYEENNP
jgi:hypothetical protein